MLVDAPLRLLLKALPTAAAQALAFCKLVGKHIGFCILEVGRTLSLHGREQLKHATRSSPPLPRSNGVPV